MRRFGLLLLLLLACGPGEDPAPPPTDSVEGPGSEALLLFFAEGELALRWREEARAVEVLDDPADRIEQGLNELLRGPEQGGGRALPPGAALEHLFWEDEGGVLTLDFTPATARLIARAGSREERIVLEALRRVLRVNYPEVRQLRILVGGEMPASLGGHLKTSPIIQLSEERG